jgi:capping protein beta
MNIILANPNFILLEIEFDTAINREFLKCEYNRDGDSYRSPWSNKYFPTPQSGEDSIFPSAELL